jgi:hypothetical protein
MTIAIHEMGHVFHQITSLPSYITLARCAVLGSVIRETVDCARHHRPVRVHARRKAQGANPSAFAHCAVRRPSPTVPLRRHFPDKRRTRGLYGRPSTRPGGRRGGSPVAGGGDVRTVEVTVGAT